MANSWLDYAMSGAQIGGKLGELGGGGDIPYGSAADYYKKYLDEARKTLEEHERTGREDITAGLTESQKYGEPYREAGESALQSYLASLGLGDTTGAEAQFRASPAYQFALQQGLKAIQRGGALTGLGGSPAEQKKMGQYATGLASQTYADWQKQLSDLASAGQTAAEAAAGRTYGAGGELAQLGLPYAGQLSGLYQQYGQTGAEAMLAAARQRAEEEKKKHGITGSILGGLAGAALKGLTGLL